MVKLFGVVHGGHEENLLGGRRDFDMAPTSGLEDALRQFPTGSRIGIENLSPEDWQEAKDQLSSLNDDFGTEVYYISLQGYWDSIARICRSCGYEVVWLEDLTKWKLYNHGIVRLAKLHKEDLIFEETDNEQSYFKKRITLNENKLNAQTFAESIHLIERDEKILENISRSDLAAVVAGVGHTDHWMLNQDKIKQHYGISFEEYATDDLVEDSSQFRGLLFNNPATPRKERSREFVNLRRAARLFKEKKLTDAVPDWVGTWDPYAFPSKGYFELFIEEKKGDQVKGRIEDLLGSARFEGIITPRVVDFEKIYDDSSREAIRTTIQYRSQDYGHDRTMHQGIYRSKTGSGFFFLEKPANRTPLQMALAWFDLCEDDTAGQMRFF